MNEEIKQRLKLMRFGEYATEIGEINNKFNEINDSLHKLPNELQDLIYEFHNENTTLQHCIRWGEKGSSEIYDEMIGEIFLYGVEYFNDCDEDLVYDCRHRTYEVFATEEEAREFKETVEAYYLFKGYFKNVYLEEDGQINYEDNYNTIDNMEIIEKYVELEEARK